MLKNSILHKIMEDKFHDECGVMGIFSPNPNDNVAQFIYYGLYALQHRGQESAGIAVSSGSGINAYKKMGLVADVFNDAVLETLKGNIGVGHVRYSTTGDSLEANAQPLVVKYRRGTLALAHNGNLVNANGIREMLEDEGVIFQTSIDTEVIANLMARYHRNGISTAVKRVMDIVKGAYALVVMTDDTLVGIRDPFGIRPLCIGKIDETYVLASESCALDTIGAELIRDVEPGEIVIIDKDGLKSIKSDKMVKKSACIFELIYFARPDSYIDGENANSFRFKTGRILAEEAHVDADRIIAVPDSGIPAAVGFSEKSGIPYGIGLIKNRYVGRTFIQPNQAMREQGVRIKLNVLRKNVEGKRVVVVDDSIVRGTTIKRIVDMLKKAGAKEVHLRISSPPVKYPCHFGIDTPSKDQLIGAIKTVDEIRQMLDVESLAYVSLDGLKKVYHGKSEYCRACFDGDYPMEVPREGNKMQFEDKAN